jgi:cytochrome b subunit of formate dehydrogenase
MLIFTPQKWRKSMFKQKGCSMKKNLFSLLALSLILTLTFLVAPIGFAATDEECLTCHGDKSLTKTDSAGKEKSLFVDESVFAKSIHKDLGCNGCHQGVLAEPHATPPGPVDCGSCHQDVLMLYQTGIHGKSRQEGAEDAPTCGDCHGYHNIRGVNDPEDPVYPVNEPKTCARCHEDVRLVSKYFIPVPTPYQAYMQSVHGKQLQEGNLGVPVCSDCHESHDLKPASDPSSSIYPTHVPSLCGECHSMEEEEYGKDIHGTALKKGNPNAPTCIDCHTSHSMKLSSDPTSSTFPANVSRFTCVYCHSQEKVVGRSGIVTEKITPNLDSYHGVMSRAGDISAASCVSCHTSNNIRPENDPLSTINKANRPQTCGKCHKGAGAHYAEGSIHIVPTSKKDLGVWWVRRIYISLIVLTIGGMFAHNAMIMIRFARERYREAKNGKVVRWRTPEIMWHFLLFVSFVTLILTGFAFRFPDSWWSSWMTHSPTAFSARGIAHRVAGVLMIGLFVYSISRSILTQRGRQQLLARLPVLSDSTNVVRNILYSVGLSSRRPEFDRYDYTEKAEYWALVWGTFVMMLTGIILWFETFFLGLMPKWLFDVAKAIHYYEAWLATLAILVWHFFFMFLHPENYPINFTAITGRMSEEAYLERHPLDYEKMIARGELMEESEEFSDHRTEGEDREGKAD